MEQIKILLVDDHKLIRDSWAFILNSDPRFNVIEATGDGDEAIEIAKEKDPDVILMDVHMTPVNGFDATKAIRAEVPRAKIIGVSMHSMPAYAKRLIQLGAMGYVTKNSSKEEMIYAILEVHAGKKYVCEEVKSILAEHEIQEQEANTNINLLSRREIDVAKLIKEGLPSKEIAQKLDITLKTVEVHRYNILKKLNLRNTASLVNFINAQGL